MLNLFTIKQVVNFIFIMKLLNWILSIGVGLCLLSIDLGSWYIRLALEEIGFGDKLVENELS